MSKRTVVIYGPSECGKTRNAEKLRKFFGCTQIQDGWDPRVDDLPPGSLALTNERPRGCGPGVQIMTYAEAARIAGLT